MAERSESARLKRVYDRAGEIVRQAYQTGWDEGFGSGYEAGYLAAGASAEALKFDFQDDEVRAAHDLTY